MLIHIFYKLRGAFVQPLSLHNFDNRNNNQNLNDNLTAIGSTINRVNTKFKMCYRQYMIHVVTLRCSPVQRFQMHRQKLIQGRSLNIGTYSQYLAQVQNQEHALYIKSISICCDVPDVVDLSKLQIDTQTIRVSVNCRSQSTVPNPIRVSLLLTI